MEDEEEEQERVQRCIVFIILMLIINLCPLANRINSNKLRENEVRYDNNEHEYEPRVVTLNTAPPTPAHQATK